jgi:hypothetical protein
MPPPDAGPRYAVYHARDPWAMLSPREDGWLSNRVLHFRHVAQVQAEGLEQVFALTNHQEESWTSHQEITWHATDAPMRSTSVGDVIVCTQTGQAWLVMPSGFRAIIPPTAPQHTTSLVCW